MDLLIPHTQAVRKGAPTVFLIGDMPYMSYQVCAQEAVRNAGRFMAECGCDAVKKEFTQDVARGRLSGDRALLQDAGARGSQARRAAHA